VHNPGVQKFCPFVTERGQACLSSSPSSAPAFLSLKHPALHTLSQVSLANEQNQLFNELTQFLFQLRRKFEFKAKHLHKEQNVVGSNPLPWMACSFNPLRT